MQQSTDLLFESAFTLIRIYVFNFLNNFTTTLQKKNLPHCRKYENRYEKMLFPINKLLWVLNTEVSNYS